MQDKIVKNLQYYKFSFYGFFKNLRFFESFLFLFFLEKGLTWVEIGFLYSIREITIALAEIPSGIIADALGRRRTLILSFLIYIFSFITFYLSQSFVLMAFAMLLFALADAFRSGVHKSMILHYLRVNGWGNQKTNYYGHTRSWSQRGSALSSLAAAVIVFYSGSYDIIFLASVIPYLLDMLLVWSYPRWLDGELKTFDTLSVRQKFSQVLKGVVFSFKHPLFFKTLINMSLYTGYYKAVKDYVQPVIKMLALSVPVLAVLNDDKKTAVFIGVLYFIIYLLTAVVSRNSGNFQKRFASYYRPMNLTLVAGFMVGIVIGLAFDINWYWIAVAGFVIIMLVENLRKPIGVALVSDLSQDEAMATILSLSSQVKSIFAAVLAPLIGWIAQLFGPGAGIATVSFILIALFPLYKLTTLKPVA